MFCEKCGKEISNNDKYCPYCGVQTRRVDKTSIHGNKKSNHKGTVIIFILFFIVCGCVWILLKSEIINEITNSADKATIEEPLIDTDNQEIAEAKGVESTASAVITSEKPGDDETSDKTTEIANENKDTMLPDKSMAQDNLYLLNRQAGAISAFGWNSFDSREFYDDDLGFWIALILEYYTDCNSNYALPVDVKEVDYVDFDPKSYSRFGCFRAERKEIDWVLNNIFHMSSPVNLNIYEDDDEEIAFAYAMNEYYYIYTDGLGIVASSTVDTSIIGKGEQGDYLIKMVIDGETFILDASLENYNGKNYWSFYSIEHQ